MNGTPSDDDGGDDEAQKRWLLVSHVQGSQYSPLDKVPVVSYVVDNMLIQLCVCR